ncbi:uncharacterized protein F4822DRAFT_411961 [Hypoxylon trugodes]|uniref:uncharacterized protein n=1 Tax=Hypoxylon trugodes TaxID=326681 RepID=UPI00219FB69D|nr:uncharacterized protein F4822DRAFT_411961 [Hypoxylon trugodes]KAI1387050.1 hypothetical protein F4822DRAFT_411961 [Hypoxylon trugodes]
MDSHNAASLPAEDDEIPLDSCTEESDSSDVSMSDSDDEDGGQRSLLISTGNEHIPIQTPLSVPVTGSVPVTQQSPDRSKKRKSLEGADSTSHTALSTKKVKLDEESCNQSSSATLLPSDKSSLPAEIWHCIFAFTPPRSLGNLLCVNKLFNAYLDPASRYQGELPPSLSRTSTPLLKPDAIWQISRRRFWQRMPAPLQQKSELDMWRLACGRTCQFCGRTNSTSPKSPDDSHQKIQSVWAFALRCCGECLLKNTIKEIDILLSSSVPSLLMPALPFVLITNETHTISPDALQKGLVQPDLQVTKIYLSEHVESLKQEFLSVKSMGGATAEEWLKGLEYRGRELLDDSMRWEKWASTGGVTQMQTQLSPENISNVTTTSGKGQHSANSSQAPRSHSSSSSIAGQHTPRPAQTTPTDQVSQSTYLPPGIPIQNESQARTPSLVQGVQPNLPRARTREEALELKAARRGEIERRAMELDPPLTANVLAHIPSFQAAIQIISPLDDNAWDMLKPRLLAQRADAEREQREKEDLVPRKAPDQPEEYRAVGESSVVTKQLIDKTWDEVQAPLRAQISAYADEVIRNRWKDGQKVDAETSPQFAADVLVQVRKMFYAEIAKESATARATGREVTEDPPEGPFTRKLTLENMKWLFDVKIKPHTESYRKDLFYCNGCDVNLKAFGFEGVIQHYAAKHTNALSLGSVVVHWRAEWPEIPPFKSEPHAMKAAHPPIGPSYGTLQSHNNTSRYPGSGAYSSAPNPPSFQVPPYGPASTPGYGHTAYGPMIQQPVPHDPRNFYPPGPPGQHEYNASYPPPSIYNPHDTAYHGQQPPYPSTAHGGPPSHPPAADAYYGQNHNASQNHSQVNFFGHYNNSPAGKYHAELEFLARTSRELWISMAALKELPGDIRVCVVIHHLLQRFRSKFSDNPSLAMFIDGLSNHKEMRPVRNVNGLVCQACHLSLGEGAPVVQDRRTYSLPQLVSHFQQGHANQRQAGSSHFLDWTIHMIHTPDLSVLSSLGSLPNIDNQKLSLILDAFPPTQSFNSYLQGAPLPGPQIPQLGVGTATLTSQQPTYNTAASQFNSQYDPLSLHSTARHDSVTPVIRDPSHAIMSNPRLDLDQSTPISTPPLPPHQKPQLGDFGRALSETRQGSSGPRLKKQKGVTKDHRTASGQGFRNRKGGVVPPSSRPKSQEPNEDELITEEERRQEEEIRAMWAADRKETARFASRNQRPIGANEPNISTSLGAERPRSPYNQVTQMIGSSAYPIQPQGYQRSMGIREREEDDLIAGLETQLDQQQVSTRQFSYRSRPTRELSYGREPPYGQQYADPEQRIYPNQNQTYGQVRPVSPVYAQQQQLGLRSSQYLESGPSPNFVNLAGGATRAAAVPDDTLYNRPLSQDYYHGYSDETQARQLVPKYTETYELVRVRDSQGEYFVRRPIRLERDHVTPLQDERAPYGSEIPHYRAYEDTEYPSRRLEYESAPVQQTYEGGVRAGRIAERSYEQILRDDPAGDEDYDPRFPAAPPNPSITRQIRYQ